MNLLSPEDKKHYRRIGHHLKPVILLGNQGLSPGLLEETSRALHDHELIKIRLSAEDREGRQEQLQALLLATDATLVQQIGKIALILRRSEKPEPKLSNLLRVHT